MLPIFNIFELGVKEGKKNAYVTVDKNNITKSVLNDKWTLGMYLVQEKENPDKWYFFEIYENEKAYQKHRKTAHFKKYIEQTKNIIENKEFINIEGIKLLY
ncbi:MAG: putative quinol monooxygenase [Leptotrichia wadei]